MESKHYWMILTLPLLLAVTGCGKQSGTDQKAGIEIVKKQAEKGVPVSSEATKVDVKKISALIKEAQEKAVSENPELAAQAEQAEPAMQPAEVTDKMNAEFMRRAQQAVLDREGT